MPRPTKIVLIEWVDSCSRFGWTHPDDVKEWAHARFSCRTSGFLLKETKEIVTICHSYDSQEDPMTNGLFQIPRVAIQSIKTIMVRDHSKRKKEKR